MWYRDTSNAYLLSRKKFQRTPSHMNEMSSILKFYSETLEEYF